MDPGQDGGPKRLQKLSADNKSLTLHAGLFFMLSRLSADFFQILTFQKVLSGTPSE